METLIKFETAKKAKEKGFDERCTHGYNTFEEGHIRNGEFRDLYDRYHGDYNGWKNSESTQDSYATAPPQSVLQKWLREVHDIKISISFYDDGKNQYWTCFIHIPSQSQQAYICGEDVYEDALERGLFEGLLLIS